MHVNRYFVLAIKGAIFSSALAIIWLKLDDPDTWSALSAVEASAISPIFLILALALLPLNIGLEAQKWREVIEPSVKVSIRRAGLAVIAASAVGLITPNRIGEFAGRILYVPAGKRTGSALLTIYGNAAQLLCTFAVGVLCGATVLLQESFVANFSPPWKAILALFALMLTTLLIYMYFKPKVILAWLRRIPWLSNKLPDWTMPMSSEFSSRIFLLSLLRYGIFCVQFYLLLKAFNVSVSFGLAMQLIAISHLLIAFVPSTFLGKIGIREAVTLSVFSFFIGNSAGIVAASLSIWLINLVVPAALGSLLVLLVPVRNT